jgi:tetratricopeptide (TPR) repeat protein
VSTDEFEELLERATAAQRMGRPEAGIPFALRAVALEPGDVTALCMLAWLQYESGRYGESLKTANDAIAADPEYEWPHRLQGNALFALGRWEAAADAMAEAVSADPTELLALKGFAWFASEVGRADEAFRTAERAVELDPNDPDCWWGLGVAAWSLQRWDVAEDALRRSRSLAPEQSYPHSSLGGLLAVRGRFHEALECFERARELDPRAPWPYMNGAYCLRSLGRWSEAQALAERYELNNLREAERQLQDGPSPLALTHRGMTFKTSRPDQGIGGCPGGGTSTCGQCGRGCEAAASSCDHEDPARR